MAQTTITYAILLSLACWYILHGGIFALVYGPRMAVPFFIIAAVFATVAALEAWLRKEI